MYLFINLFTHQILNESLSCNRFAYLNLHVNKTKLKFSRPVIYKVSINSKLKISFL